MILKVGLEIHIPIASSKKLFCECIPNKNSCPICEGFPGAKIKNNIDKELLEKCSLLIDKLNFKTNNLIFYRKHYFYPDLPKGYQLTQHPEEPLGYQGSLTIPFTKKTILFDKICLEEDPAGINKNNIVYARSGNPLLEASTSPFFINLKENYRKELIYFWWTFKNILLDLQISNRKDFLKIDVNISKLDSTYRIEVKNISSLKDILEIFKTLEKNDTILTKYSKNITCNYKNGVIRYSRDKKDYLYSQEYNIDSINLPIVKASLTLYDFLLKITDGLTNPNFVIVAIKQLMRHNYNELIDFLKTNKTISQLKLFYNKMNDQKLYDNLDSCLAQTKTEKQFNTFKEFLEILKNNLRQKSPKFKLKEDMFIKIKKYFDETVCV